MRYPAYTYIKKPYRQACVIVFLFLCYSINKQCPARRRAFQAVKKLGVDKGPQPLMFNPALTTCASERMKTQRFSFFAGFAARELMREAKPVKLKKVAVSHFFDTLRCPARRRASYPALICPNILLSSYLRRPRAFPRLYSQGDPPLRLFCR